MGLTSDVGIRAIITIHYPAEKDARWPGEVGGVYRPEVEVKVAIMVTFEVAIEITLMAQE